MPWNVGQNFTVSTFQSADGSNYTTAGYDIKFKGGLAVYGGIGTNFENGHHGVLDLKESNPYKEGSLFSQNLRIRTKYDDKFLSTQVRFSPLTVNVPLGKTTSAYLNTHYSGTYDYQNEKMTHSAGAFLGATQKLNDNVSVSAEVQRYNLQDISDNSGKNWSGNVIFSVKLP